MSDKWAIMMRNVKNKINIQVGSFMTVVKFKLL